MSKKLRYGVVDRKSAYKEMFKNLDGRGDGPDSLYTEMDAIQDYLGSCYFLCINPLPNLRDILPQFTWQFAKCGNLDQVKKLIARSDLIWQVNHWVTDWAEKEEVDLVIANSLAKRRRIFFAGDKKASETTTRRLEFVKTCGGEPEYGEIINQ